MIVYAFGQVPAISYFQGLQGFQGPAGARGGTGERVSRH